LALDEARVVHAGGMVGEIADGLADLLGRVGAKLGANVGVARGWGEGGEGDEDRRRPGVEQVTLERFDPG
jgi:hypothetical protein